MGTHSQDFLTQLAELRAAHCDSMPTPQMAVLVRLTARLRRSGLLQRALQVGETAPNFVFARSDGSRSDLYTVLETGPVVLNFFRGLWCAYCRTEIEAYNSIRQRLSEAGCSYLAISPQPVDESDDPDAVSLIYDRHNEIAEQFKLVYPLEEEELRLFDELGVRDRVDGASRMPLPATYLIASDRTVAFRFVDADFRSRCCPEDLLEEIRALVSQP